MLADAARPLGKKQDKGLPTLATELWEMVVAYLKQQTLEPLKGLARFLGLGVVAALLLGSGLLFLSVGLLRILQVETVPHWTGSWSWLPYVLTLIVVAAIAALVASRIGAVKRKGMR
jgi:hypothetical protein